MVVDSILQTVKNSLGIDAECTDFDSQIITHINSVLFILMQLGVGPPDGFSISDETSTWSDFFGSTRQLESVKSYMYLEVRLLFDPPTSSAVLDSMRKMAEEYKWRINVAADT